MPSRNENDLDNAKDNNSFRVSTQPQPVPPPGSSPVQAAQLRKQVAPLILRFLITWLGFIAVLWGLALLTDINWARSFMQQALGETLHRDVTLGRLTWSFGLDGLEIDTRKLVVKEHDGRPFLVANNSGIGVAFKPLLHGKLLLRHVSFQQPELWAIRTGKGKWNFSDLLEYGPDIRYIRCDGGLIHVVDKIPQQTPAWQALDLQHFKLSFLWPRKHSKTPFFLAFKLPGKDYATALQVTGLRSGKNVRWQDDNYSFELKAEKLNPNDLRPLLNALGPHPVINAAANEKKANDLNGLFDATVNGEGVFSKAINTKLTASAQNFSFNAAPLGTLQAPQATLTAQLVVNDKKVQWHDLDLRLSDILLKSEGELDNWLSQNASYEAKVGSKVADLSHMQKLLAFEQQIVESAQQSQQHWTGKAEVEVHLLGDSKGSKVDTQINAEEVLAKTLVEALPPESRPLADMLGFTNEAKLKGKVRILPGESIALKDAELPICVGTVHANGTIDLKKQLTTFTFKGDDLKLERIQDKLNEKMHGHGKRAAEVARGVNVKVAGAFNLSGDVSIKKDETNSSGTINLHQAQFALSDNSLDMRNITGDISWKNDKVQFNKLHGDIGDGTFVLAGNSALAANSNMNLRLEAKHAQLDQLEAVLKILQLQFPILTERQLYGRVKDLVLVVTGNPQKPNVYLNATPDDMYFQPPGLLRPLRVRGGTIVYDHDNLSLSDLALLVRGDKVAANVEITDLSHSATLKNIKVKTSGLDLADAHYYLSSQLMPPPLRKAYTSFLHQFALSSLHGRVYGDLACQPSGNHINLEGAIGMLGVGARLGAHGFPVEHVQGTAAASGNRLLVQNMTGSIRNSKFDLDGHIDNYLDANPAWSMQLGASLEPRELLELVPTMNERVQAWHPQVSASSALDLKATVNGDNGRNDISFNLIADPKDMLGVSTVYGAIYQPKDEAVNLDGVLHSDGSGIQLTDAHLTVGKSTLEASGSIVYAADAGTAQKRADSAPIDLSNAKVDLHVATTKPMPAYKLVSMLDPSIAKKDVQGTIDGSLSVGGSFAHPKPAGKLKVDKLTWKMCDLYDVTGTASMAAAKDGEKQIGKLELSGLAYKKLPIKNITADLSFNTAGDNQASLAVSDGKATVAGGTVNASGSFDFNSHIVTFSCALDKLKAAVLADELFEHPGEISGLTDGNLNLSTQGADYKTLVSNLQGNGQLTMYNGSVSRFGHLQAKLTQANLLHQGLFGFNLNNLLQSVYPVRTGFFKDLSSKFQMEKGVLTITQLRYNGDDMRLWGAGTANLTLDTMSVEVAGQIPRVTSSVIGGPVGEVSRAFTLQRVLDTVTLHRLETLPNLPLLGEIASNKPRTFSFRVLAPLDNSKMLVQSIEKSFHWLPPKPGATAHPVPGLQ